MIVYKLFKKRKDNSIGPLFINQRLRIPVGEWLDAEDHPTKNFAHRPGFHTLLQPIAPHLKMMENRVWAKCEIDDYQFFTRPVNQGGKWALANRMRVLEIYH